MKKKYLQPRTKTFSVRAERMCADSSDSSMDYSNAPSAKGITPEAKGDDGDIGW